MSHLGKPAIIMRFNLAELGISLPHNSAKFLVVELFNAKQFKSACSIMKRNFSPPKTGLSSGYYWNGKYRLRVDGRWYKVNNKQYSFFSMVEAVKYVF